MVWSSLGTVQAGQGFQYFDTDVIGPATVLFVHETNIPAVSCVGYVTQFFGGVRSGVQVVPWRKIYSSEVSQIISFPLPTGFEEMGATVWSLQFKARYPYFNVDWRLTAFQWLIG